MLRCACNTYRPQLNGTLRRVVNAGPSVVTFDVGGDAFRMQWPKAGDVIEVSDQVITFRLSLPSCRGDHQLTLEKVH